ncbi:MAG: hypothetical protein JST16_11015 [Bdellovibrionales bacterium]|nr:hypothetical protein [Bdellovibrionales bacterium]
MKKFSFLCGLSFLVACSGEPGRERFPGPPGRTTEIQQAEAQKAVMGGFDPTRNAVAAGTANAPALSGKTLKGVVRLGKGVKAAGKFFFLSVRPAAGGPPLAARKEMDVKLPYEFNLSAADVMIPGTPFEGEVQVTARIKQDGNPLSLVKGDYSGSVRAKIGDQKVEIVVDQPAE